MPQCVIYVALRHTGCRDLVAGAERRVRQLGWMLFGFSVSLLGLTIASGQVIPSVGGEATLDVATWNVYWFGHPFNGPVDEEKQFVHVRETIRQSDIDLWALQEVSSEDVFDRLLTELGSGYAGEFATSGSEQRLAFVYRTDVVFPRGLPSARHILTNQSTAFAGRPPLRVDATIAVADTTFDVIIITLHMKAFGDIDSYQRRLSASSALKNYLDFLHPRDAVLVLGDFNDRLSGSIASGKSSPYVNFTSDAARYRFVSEHLDERNVPTWCANFACSAGTPLDHILITDELFSLYQEDSADRMEHLLQALPGFVFNTSDHLPVVARFATRRVTTSTERTVPLAKRDGDLSVYPSPFTHDLYIATETAPLEVTIFDALGRRVFQVTPSGAGLHVDTASWSPGLYLVAVRHADSHRVLPVVRVR